ncbi:hypothetical protein [Inquilinus limosus]|uniref:Uncharacterized protein n=1 Tax=Inquilinus limosus MP06 TaxID=1398085 RepID=A0A0A0DDN2_9PROT|nr:hypothetical protein [Inquilinus limosus]KGM36155.1 hypothetical protein P409_00470 [Inquilinus limosus MP06]
MTAPTPDQIKILVGAVREILDDFPYIGEKFDPLREALKPFEEPAPTQTPVLKTYRVDVRRMYYSTATIDVEARDEHDARYQALHIIEPNWPEPDVFGDEIDSITEVTP